MTPTSFREIKDEYRKNHEMVFEACKHFTTLDTAAALVLVAVFREAGVGINGAFWPLLCFGISLVSCAIGMMTTALRGLEDNKAALSATGSLIFGASVFFFGLVVTVFTVLPE